METNRYNPDVTSFVMATKNCDQPLMFTYFINAIWNTWANSFYPELNIFILTTKNGDQRLFSIKINAFWNTKITYFHRAVFCFILTTQKTATNSYILFKLNVILKFGVNQILSRYGHIHLNYTTTKTGSDFSLKLMQFKYGDKQILSRHRYPHRNHK
jgi:hypothetical protein